MKKIFFSAVISLFFLSTTAQSAKKNSSATTVDSFTVDRSGIATVYLSNGTAENMTTIVYSDGSKPAKLKNREGLLLTPPYKPSSWDKKWDEETQSFFRIPIGYVRNAGFGSTGMAGIDMGFSGPVFVIEGVYNASNGTWSYFGKTVICSFTNTPRPIDWIKQYDQANWATNSIPGFSQKVKVSKRSDGNYIVE